MMRAAVVDRPGPARSIRLARLPVPEPGPTDVLVAVTASAVNPVDTLIRSGAYATPMPAPFVIGRDLVGEVAAVGPGAAHRFRPGQPVWCNSLGHGGRQGAAAEYAVVPQDRLYPLPEGADPVAAVAAAHPAATAYLALVRHGGLRAGQTVYVGGGAGNVGGALVELARAAGARVVASARDGDAGHCRARGATEVLDYRDPRLAERLAAAAPEGVDLFVDTSGRQDLELALAVLAYGGRVVLLAGWDARPSLPVRAVYLRGATLTGFAISHATVSELAAAARRLNQLFAVGALVPRTVRELPLAAAGDAHLELERGRARGLRIVLRCR